MIVKTFWWKQVPNFGDRLTPFLLTRFANVGATWAPISEANLFGVGSIIDLIPNDWRGIILGSGKLRPNFEFKQTHRKQILALRGELTAKGVKGDFALGDPGLLANELVRVDTKKYELGIIPHWSDTELLQRPEFKKFNPKVINPRADPLEVIKTIGECRKIVSSSLHGIIVADAFGIPRRFEYAKQFDKEGGIFKFQDYSSAIKTPFEVGKLIAPSRFHIEDRQHEIFDAFQELRSML